MTRAEKRQLVQQLLAEDPTRSNREIGRVAGVDHVTVGAVRRDLEARGEIHQPSETHHEIHQPPLNGEFRHAGETHRSKASGEIHGVETHHTADGEIHQPENHHRQINGEIHQGSGELIDLATAPVEEIVATIKAWPEERRAAFMRALLAQPGARNGEWKFRTSPEVRAAIIAAKAAGMGIVPISKQFGVKRQTAHSIIRKARTGEIG